MSTLNLTINYCNRNWGAEVGDLVSKFESSFDEVTHVTKVDGNIHHVSLNVFSRSSQDATLTNDGYDGVLYQILNDTVSDYVPYYVDGVITNDEGADIKIWLDSRKQIMVANQRDNKVFECSSRPL